MAFECNFVNNPAHTNVSVGNNTQQLCFTSRIDFYGTMGENIDSFVVEVCEALEAAFEREGWSVVTDHIFVELEMDRNLRQSPQGYFLFLFLIIANVAGAFFS